MAGEFYHIVYRNVYGIASCVFRLTNTIGPRMRVKDARQTFLGWWIRQILEGKEIEIFGNGEQLRDFNYVDDVVDALILGALSSEVEGQILNLGHREVISLKELAAMLIEVTGEGSCNVVPFPADRKAIDIGDYYGDYGLCETLLGWRPKTSLRDALQRTLDYYRTHGPHYWP